MIRAHRVDLGAQLRKAEKYLIDSGLSYTIVHPGGPL